MNSIGTHTQASLTILREGGGREGGGRRKKGGRVKRRAKKAKPELVEV
jgi:hypothetical protein